MINNTNKEQWIDEVMNSTHGMTRAQPQADLYEQILANLNNGERVVIISIPVKKWAIAAVLLLSLNIGSVIYYAGYSKKPAAAHTTNFLAVQMQLESTYNY